MNTGSCENPEAITSYLDGEGSVVERARLASHLATCARCQALADQYTAVSRSLAAAPEIEPSDQFESRVAEMVAGGSVSQWLFPQRLSPVLAAAALILGVVVGVHLHDSRAIANSRAHIAPLHLAVDLDGFTPDDSGTFDGRYRSLMEAIR